MGFNFFSIIWGVGPPLSNPLCNNYAGMLRIGIMHAGDRGGKNNTFRATPLPVLVLKLHPKPFLLDSVTERRIQSSTPLLICSFPAQAGVNSSASSGLPPLKHLQKLLPVFYQFFTSFLHP